MYFGQAPLRSEKLRACDNRILAASSPVVGIRVLLPPTGKSPVCLWVIQPQPLCTAGALYGARGSMFGEVSLTAIIVWVGLNNKLPHGSRNGHTHTWHCTKGPPRPQGHLRSQAAAAGMNVLSSPQLHLMAHLVSRKRPFASS